MAHQLVADQRVHPGALQKAAKALETAARDGTGDRPALHAALEAEAGVVLTSLEALAPPAAPTVAAVGGRPAEAPSAPAAAAPPEAIRPLLDRLGSALGEADCDAAQKVLGELQALALPAGWPKAAAAIAAQVGDYDFDSASAAAAALREALERGTPP